MTHVTEFVPKKNNQPKNSQPQAPNESSNQRSTNQLPQNQLYQPNIQPRQTYQPNIQQNQQDSVVYSQANAQGVTQQVKTEAPQQPKKGYLSMRLDFPRQWTFYVIVISTSQEKRSYQVEELCSFQDSFSFFKYYRSFLPFSEWKVLPDKRISLALFADNIKPAWEDDKNKSGQVYTFNISFGDNEKEKFMKFKRCIDDVWETALFKLIGENIKLENASESIANGITFALKTSQRPNQKGQYENWNLYELQVWFSSVSKDKDAIKTAIENEVIKKNFPQEIVKSLSLTSKIVDVHDQLSASTGGSKGNNFRKPYNQSLRH